MMLLGKGLEVCGVATCGAAMAHPSRVRLSLWLEGWCLGQDGAGRMDIQKKQEEGT